MDKDFESLKECFLKYVDENNLGADEIIKTTDKLSDIAIRLLTERDPYVYVFKRGRFLQRYNEEKIQYSIENAGKNAGVELSLSDINLIVNEALRPYKKDQIIYAADLRESIKNAMIDNGFESVAEAYSSH